MGYCTYYDNRNKVTDQALLVKYRTETKLTEVIDQQGSPKVIPYFHLTRYATKVYRYVGMDYDTAKGCLGDKLHQYTRAYQQVIENNFGPDPEGDTWKEIVNECKTDIAMTRQDGNMWSVTISVNEEDHTLTLDQVLNPADFFGPQNRRNYDEDEGGSEGNLVLLTAARDTQVSYNKVVFSYDASGIKDFDAKYLTFSWKTGYEEQWHVGSDNVSIFDVTVRLVYNHWGNPIFSNTLEVMGVGPGPI